jgi:hypothetical protein
MTPAILKASWNPCGLSRRHHPQIEQSLQLGFDLGAKPIDPVAVVHKSVLLQSRDDSAHVRFLIAAPVASLSLDLEFQIHSRPLHSRLRQYRVCL